jgi:hypothetical protein
MGGEDASPRRYERLYPGLRWLVGY